MLMFTSVTNFKGLRPTSIIYFLNDSLPISSAHDSSSNKTPYMLYPFHDSTKLELIQYAPDATALTLATP